MTAEKRNKKSEQQEQQAQEDVHQENPVEGTETSPQPPAFDVVPEDSGESTGAVRISEDVIASVVRKYTLEVEGVVRFASNTIVSGLAEMIGRKSHDSNVVVQLEDDAVNIQLTLVLQFGVKIPEVATLIQDVIKNRVEEQTGKQVNRVDVIVQGLEENEEEAEAEAEAEAETGAQQAAAE